MVELYNRNELAKESPRVRVPPNVVHYAEPVGDEACLNLDVFAPVRADYLHRVEYQANGS